MIEIIENPNTENWNELQVRGTTQVINLVKPVKDIIENIKSNGDRALIEYSAKFDGVDLTTFIDNRDGLSLSINEDLKLAINRAKNNIYKFHLAQKTKNIELNTERGITCWRETRAIDSVGLYIPGGTAPLYSTLLMLGIPAKIAGVKNIVVTSPPVQNKKVNDVIRYTASLLDIENVYTLGGAQAIAALGLGTKSIPKVFKIFGPGNAYVDSAKRLIQSEEKVAIDLPAGPTELLIISDKEAKPKFLAADIISQIEHGIDSQVILLGTDKEIISKTIESTLSLIETQKRSDILKTSIKNCKFIYFNELESAIKFSNSYAPEHLILALKNAKIISKKITTAGSVFIGNYTPESFGDYASGTNHTLPTNAYANMYSGVNLGSFVKEITFQEATKFGAKNLGDTVITLANNEDLPGHALAVKERLNTLSNEKYAFNIDNYVRPHTRNLKAYSSARSEYKNDAAILLDANENALGSVSNSNLNRYPCPKQEKLRERIAKLNNIQDKNVFLGNGSDEIIDLLVRLFCEPGVDKLSFFTPSFGMYKVCAKINNVDIEEISLSDDFEIKDFSILEKENIKLCFLCNPNNPTGNLYSVKKIEEILNKINGILVVDEAYIEFSSNKNGVIKLLSQYKNLCIIRTFSKAYGLAASRVGYLLGDEKLVNYLDTIKAPYNISSLNANSAILAIDNQDELNKKVRELVKNREFLFSKLSNFKFISKIYPSEANFLLVKVNNAKKVYESLRENKLIVRLRDSLIKDTIRISIGTKEENEILVKLLEEI